MALGEYPHESREFGPYILWRVYREIRSIWNTDSASFSLVPVLLERKPRDAIWIKVEMFLNTLKYATLATASTLAFYSKI